MNVGQFYCKRLHDLYVIFFHSFPHLVTFTDFHNNLWFIWLCGTDLNRSWHSWCMKVAFTELAWCRDTNLAFLVLSSHHTMLEPNCKRQVELIVPSVAEYAAPIKTENFEDELVIQGFLKTSVPVKAVRWLCSIDFRHVILETWHMLGYVSL